MAIKIYATTNYLVLEELGVKTRYAKHLTSFQEGLNSITLKLSDREGNIETKAIPFDDIQTEAGIAYSSMVVLVEFLDENTVFNKGGGNGSGVTDSLEDIDYWYESNFTQSLTSPQYLTGAALSGGTVTFGAAEARINFPFHAQITTSTSNSQVSWIAGGTLTGSSANGYPSHFFNNADELYFVIPSIALPQRRLRTGILNSVVLQNAVSNGIFIEINDLVASAICSNTSTTTTHATTVTLSTLTMYRAVVSVNANNTGARFQIFTFGNSTAIWDVVITTNLPTGTAGVSHRCVGGGVGTTPVDTAAFYFYKFNYGTKKARKYLTGRE